MVLETVNQDNKKHLDHAELDRHIFEMIKKARMLKTQNYSGSIQETVFSDLRKYLEEHSS